ncbi:hypothetical protein FM996_12705 [Methylosinus sporium]|uniref:Secreted protein n=1 Tax=Methylosinus sporium TaxID=428 RepID=A0A549SRG8_METSR|nr:MULTISPECIES: hypothetical protein [Methylosinus]MBU3886971.1 hypothetical protein [Methylosinus sp. KRF6]TRL32226.1 hypothetical protein FM996_12705 [Methylosinus sporium]
MNRSICICLLCALSSAAAAKNLLIEKIPPSGACFFNRFDEAYLRAHPGQTIVSVRLSLRREFPAAAENERELRVEFRHKGHGKPFYVVGGCAWSEEANRDVGGHRLARSFREDAAARCVAHGGLGRAAAEGGDFPIDLSEDGASLTLYLDESVSGWRGPDQNKKAIRLELTRHNRVFELERVDASACVELDKAVAVD